MILNLDCRYNSSDHPIPFHKATDLGKAPKKLAVEQVPDLEEAFDVSLYAPFPIRVLMSPSSMKPWKMLPRTKRIKKTPKISPTISSFRHRRRKVPPGRQRQRSDLDGGSLGTIQFGYVHI